MAVYFEPRNRGFWDYVAPVVGNILGGMVGEGFEKNKEIRVQKYANEAADADQRRRWADTDRSQEMLRNLGFKLGPDYPMNMREDPNGAMGYLTMLGLINPNGKYDEYLKNLNPQQQFTGVSLGDKMRAGSYDPLSGTWSAQDYTVGIDPTKQMEQDAATKRTGMSEAGANARHRSSMDLAMQKLLQDRNFSNLIQTGDGNYAWADSYEKTMTPTEFTAPQAGAQGISVDALVKIMEMNRHPLSGQPLNPELDQALSAVVMGMLGMGEQGANNELPLQPTETSMNNTGASAPSSWGGGYDPLMYLSPEALQAVKATGASDNEIRMMILKEMGMK